MREIKFRAWDKEQKGMTLPFTLKQAFAMKDIRFDIEVCYDVMQYTGLKDKNGKESYIGDICKDNEGEIFYIEQDPVLIYAKYSDIDMLTFGWEIWDSNQFEVIGNIYENPELLEQTMPYEL
jgi:hypothetical protein